MTTLTVLTYFQRRLISLKMRELLFYCRRRDCEDGRDKIYALHGLIDDRWDPRLQPDYELSMEEVYTKATKYIIDSVD